MKNVAAILNECDFKFTVGPCVKVNTQLEPPPPPSLIKGGGVRVVGPSKN